MIATQGLCGPRGGNSYTRPGVVPQLGEAPQLFPVLWGLWVFHLNRGRAAARRRRWPRSVCNAQSRRTRPLVLLEAHLALQGHLPTPRGVCPCPGGAGAEHGTLPTPAPCSDAPLYGGFNPQVGSLVFTAWALWSLGFPEQALMRMHEVLTPGAGARSPRSRDCLDTGPLGCMRSVVDRTSVAQEHADAVAGACRASTGFPFMWQGNCPAGSSADRAGTMGGGNRSGTAA